MWITYTFDSRAMEAEESATLLFPHPHQVASGAYTPEDLYRSRRLLPALFVMGDEGTEHNWWMRHSFAEGDIHRDVCAIVCVRGMAQSEAVLRFLGEELPTLMCAQFPINPDRMYLMGWKRTAALARQLDGGAFRIVAPKEEDCAEALAHAVRIASEKER